MAKPAKFVINYAPQVRKGPISSPSLPSLELTLLAELQARCAFCRKHFKQNKLRIGTKLPSGDIQWRHTNRKCRAWQYVLSRAQGPEEFEGWLQIKYTLYGGRELTGRALDKKKVKRQFVPKTKARIMRRETTVPKVPEDPEEEKKLKQGKAAEKVVKAEEEEKSKDEDEDMSDVESDEDDSEEESAPKTNGKNVEPAAAVAASTSNHSGDDAKGRYQKILETRMAEIQHVFAKGAATYMTNFNVIREGQRSIGQS